MWGLLRALHAGSDGGVDTPYHMFFHSIKHFKTNTVYFSRVLHRLLSSRSQAECQTYTLFSSLLLTLTTFNQSSKTFF